ncbi:MAG: N-acetylglucosamine-6-phosphate deacetylase [Clostridia bacterium]|nr:N-acetylglucosamine-6-phosphate deacetylase [Clostridia bacterium]
MIVRNGKLFMDGKFQEGPDVRVFNGRIHEIGYHLQAGLYEQITDVDGDMIMPGFVDVHIHAFRRNDTMQGEEAIRAMSRDLYREGVSAFCPTTMSASLVDTRNAVNGIRRVMLQPEVNGCQVLGAHMEAPFLQEEKAGAQRKEFFMDPSIDAFMEMTDHHPESVKLITVAPERPGAESFIRAVTALGVHVSAGHTKATAEQVHLAGDWGVDHITHTFNAQTPLLHRAPGVPGAGLSDDRFYCEMICDGIHLHRDIVRLIAKCKGPQHAVAITDAMEAAGMPDGEYALGGQAVFVHGSEARLKDGTLAGSVLTMHKAFENLIHFFGLKPEDAAVMCTSAPADSIGEKLAGRLIAGAPAPLTRWTKDFHMAGIID